MTHRKAPDDAPIEIAIPLGHVRLEGTLTLPPSPRGIVLFAHGSGSSRRSPRNVFVAGVLVAAGIATLLFDLLTAGEDRDYATRFDIGLLSQRLARARRAGCAPTRRGPRCRSATSARAPGRRRRWSPRRRRAAGVAAVVSRGGRPDLAGAGALARVRAPTLLVVGGEDDVVIELNRAAYAHLHCEKELRIVPGATHLFEEPGALEVVADLAVGWFTRWLRSGP